MSDKFVVNPETTFPVLISSTPYNYGDYDYDGKTVKVTLKYNDILILDNTNKKEDIDISSYNTLYTTSPYFVSHVLYNEYSNLKNVDGKNYLWEYSLVTFYCTFSSYDLSNTNYDSSPTTYFFSLKNLVDSHTFEEPCQFYYTIYSYKDSSLNPQKKLIINEKKYELKGKETVNLNYDILSEDVLEENINWTSSNDSVAIVNNNGVVTATGTGKAYIYATDLYSDEIYDYTVIYVTDKNSEDDNKDSDVKASHIKITAVPSNIRPGNSFKLAATVSPSNATNKKVTWKSSNTNYATVDSNGTVKIKTAGAGKTVKITATAKDGSNVSKTVTLKIQPIKVSKIIIKASKSSVVAGKSLKLTANINPSNATNKKVTWKSSNTKYATVNSSGVVVTKKAGKGKNVKITATAADGSKIKSTITIKIK